MKMLIAKTAGLVALVIASLSGSALAASAIVERAKAECIVGEQSDGYLGIVAPSQASEELKREVRAINQQRKAYYAQIAERNGVTIDVTARLTAQKLIAQAPRGQCVKDDTGRWKEK